jgi:hypothetical protein
MKPLSGIIFFAVEAKLACQIAEFGLLGSLAYSWVNVPSLKGQRTLLASKNQIKKGVI